MVMLGPLGFGAPWVLVALGALPVLWLVLRAVPPAPRRVVFPGLALLAGLQAQRPEARRTPWWLLALRLAALAALIVGFAGPVWRPAPAPGGPGEGPVLIVLDAGWQAAPGWSQAVARAQAVLGQAGAAGRPVGLVLADGRNEVVAFDAAGAVAPALAAARPAGWGTALAGDPAAALALMPQGRPDAIWISDGSDYPGRAEWARALMAQGNLRIVPPAPGLWAASLTAGDAPAIALHGSDAAPAPASAPTHVLAIGPGPQGAAQALAQLAVADGRAAIDLPPELRNRITRYQIAGQDHAGAVILADDSTRRRKVALTGPPDRAGEGQALLSPLHYLRQALAPTTDLIEGGLADVLDAAPDVVVLVDQPDPAGAARLAEWVQAGGLLIRFAGPRMAAAPDLAGDPLLPVRLRPGGRDIGGALSWGDPRRLAPFAEGGVFAGLAPPPEVAIRAQLMAEPAPDLAERTIAALSDNTPLVTRARRGAGQIVLFHTTANAEWSDLALSGLFVQMLNRLVATARAAAPEGAAAQADFWAPVTVLDGFGQAQDPGAMAPVAAADLARGAGPGRPAGLYRAGEALRALNAGGPWQAAQWPAGAVIEDRRAAPQGRALAGWLLALAGALLAGDALASGRLAGRRSGRHAAAVMLALALGGLPRAQAQAQDVDPRLADAAGQFAMAYVITGDQAVDRASAQGLAGLGQVLAARTSVRPGPPVAVDLDADDLAPLTLIYWPVTPDQPAPAPMAYLRLNQFLRTGGVILFDTRDGDIAGMGGPDASAALQALAAPLDVPPLAPVPDDHVLTRSFYLLDGFAGRWDGGAIWAEAPPPDAEALGEAPFRMLNDGVSPVIIGGNGWAEAWATDDAGVPQFPVGQGWEGETRREAARRFGVNLVMYVLTGNYKSDQVHVPALLERMGQGVP